MLCDFSFALVNISYCLLINLSNLKANSNGVTTIVEPHGWSWIDQPMVGECKDGLNVYAITEPPSISNCYRQDIRINGRFLL